MMPTLFIGIGHKARQGKNLVAYALMDKLRLMGFDARVMAFADALKAVARSEYGMRGKDAALLQRLGVERREKNLNHWIDILHDAILEESPDIVLIPDMRFENEVAFVEAQRGIRVKVTRYTAELKPFVSPDRPADHISETALDTYRGWDVIINNEGTPADLASDARRLVLPFVRQYFDGKH